MTNVIWNKDVAKRVARLLIENNAYNIEFRKKSLEWVRRKGGLMSPVYINCRNLLAKVPVVNEINSYLEEMIKDRFPQVDALFGIETAGIPYSSMLSIKLNKPAGYIRKKPKSYGIKTLVEGDPGQNLKGLIVDDNCFTGDTIVKSIRALYQEKKIKSLGAATIVTLSKYGYNNKWDYFKRKGLDLVSLTNFEYLQDEAKEMGLLNDDEADLLNGYYKDPLNFNWNK